MNNYKYLIIGGGMTADAAAKGIREIDPDGSIGLFSMETDPPYKRPLLSKGLWKGKPFDSVWRHTESQHVTLHLGQKIVSLDAGQLVVLAVREPSTLPGRFELQQNYPNPFNPSTQINFSIPQAGNVSLKVYNVLGQEVATLMDGVKSAQTYNVTFDASSLSSGVYFYTLKFGEQSISKKMLLLK